MAAAAGVLLLASGCSDCVGKRASGPGEIVGSAVAPEALRARAQARERAAQQVGAASSAAGSAPAPQILFGDLHVHTTYSIDAFLQGLPLFGGEGAHPPADACDFARYCADLDFFSFNDHAESLPPARWREITQTVRECNARAGDPANPDMVVFTGYEWTQVGATPATHWGHKNVIFRGEGERDVPARPIDSLPADVAKGVRGIGLIETLGELDALGMYADFFALLAELAQATPCKPGIDTRELPGDCRESAATPRELFEKLEQSGLESIVIPHGLAWGEHAPPGARLDNQLVDGQHDPGRQRLIEVHSGHGNGESFREALLLERDADGDLVCPEPTADFLPCCWRAGELMRDRCGDLPEEECEARVRSARRLALEAGTSPSRVFPDARPEDWLDCDQCRDCFKPVFNLRPGMSAQYAVALSRPADWKGAPPKRFRWGFIASSDNHSARPGNGYKQIGRHGITDVRGVRSPTADRVLKRLTVEGADDPQRPQPVGFDERSFAGLLNRERAASFLYPGGVVAVHAAGRDRDAIWQALEARRVYGTSGPRILLWFDLLNDDGTRLPMGSALERTRGSHPRFEVRAVGAPLQAPGCPAERAAALGEARLAALCLGECDNPLPQRHLIEAIEVVRIRPQETPDEPVADLIDDPWRRFECPPDPAGCVARFEDDAFARDSLYYVRAVQAPTPAINGANLRTRFAPDGRPLDVDPCYAGWQTAWDDDCLAPVGERAWSSPIYIDVSPDMETAAHPQALPQEGNP